MVHNNKALGGNILPHHQDMKSTKSQLSCIVAMTVTNLLPICYSFTNLNDSSLSGLDDWMAEFIDRRPTVPSSCVQATHEPAGVPPDRSDTHRIRIPRQPDFPQKPQAKPLHPPVFRPPASQAPKPTPRSSLSHPVSRNYIRAPAFARRPTNSLVATPTLHSHLCLLQSPGPGAAQPTQRTRCRPTASPSAPALRWRQPTHAAGGNAACRRRPQSRRPPRAPA